MITLPKLFQRKLAENPSLASAVSESLTRFEPWLANSGMPFFPAFTDHSPRHITDVLETAASLISDASHELLSAEDVAVLCMAILLHDCGMHLTQDTFRVLVADKSPALISGLNDLPWAQLWSEFLAEANRFGQEKLLAIFGDTEPIVVSNLDLKNLSERDHLLIGEFVRRHHTRLAHEIALMGVSGGGGAPLALAGFDDELKDIAGLVARSHGMSIRSTFSYIRSKYYLVSIFRNIKIPYLMAVLRIADYVQVKSERAIKALLSVKELRSPISRQEWAAHFAVRDVHTHHDDPEALYVHASPVDAKTYLKLGALFKDIQRELDESWGTLGEVYGRNSELSQLGLSIRRVRSNMDSVESFARTVNYIPINARFDSSGPELLKLLVGPLYDYEYQVGIRELVQNAADACKELRDLSHGGSGGPVETDILVEIDEAEDGAGLITITDNGVGMTLDTVTKYFLIAGASFRNSELWKRQHTDDSGSARITRGGRFGIGALAAFLLGDEIRVQTRHVGRADMEGIEFAAKIDDPVVELRRCQAPVGTRIQICVSNPEVVNSLRPTGILIHARRNETLVLDEWSEVDWLVQDTPRVLFKWNGYNYSSSQDYSAYSDRFKFSAIFSPPEYKFVPVDGVETGDWKSLPEPAPYKSILWRYIRQRVQRRGGVESLVQPPDQIVVNGIHVQAVSDSRRSRKLELPEIETEYGPIYTLPRPSMAIYDPAGVCPINLQRNSVAFERMGIDQKLAASLLAHHFERLKSDFSNVRSVHDFIAACESCVSGRQINYEGQIYPLCVSRSGLFLATPEAIADLGIKTLFFVDIDDGLDSSVLKNVLRDGEAIMIREREADRGKQAALAWFRGIFAIDPRWSFSHSRGIGAPALATIAQYSLMPVARWESANEKGKVTRAILEALRYSKSSPSQVFVAAGDRSNDDEMRGRLQSLFSDAIGAREVAAWRLSSLQPNANNRTMIYNAWVSVFGNSAVPLAKRSVPAAGRILRGKAKVGKEAA